jgi:ribosomal protein S6--L-glutamate ligase
MSHEGEGIYLIRGPSDLQVGLEDIRKKGDSGFISQDLIPSEGNVLRAVILEEGIRTYWKRPSETGQMITTISSGSEIDEAWRPELQKKGAMQARQVSRESGINLAALDFVFPFTDPQPRPFILEINYFFGRRGLGGSLRYYRLLLDAVREWLGKNGFDPESVSLV